MFKKFISHILSSQSLVWAAVFLVFVAGVAVLPGLKADLFPPLDFPILAIITEMPSFSSLEIERQVTVPIESAVSGVLGVTGVKSVMANGISMVSAHFQWGTDMLTARAMVLQALAQVRGQLPPEAEPTVENLSATLAMIEGYSLQGKDANPVWLRDTALFTLKPRLQGILGVYKVVIMGGRISEFSVYPNPFLLIKYNLTLDALRQALAANNILSSPGIINHYAQELVLHADGQFSGVKDIENVVVAIEAGQAVRVKDIAKVEGGFEFQRQDTSENGSPSVLINVYKQPSFDTISVADAVNAEIHRFEKNLPKNISIHNYYDQAQLVRGSIGSVKESVWVGAVLVVLVLFAFLRDFKMTLAATLSLPISIIAALALMRLFGIGLNVMSLGGMAVGCGIIVDDAIVVLENIHRHFSTPELSRDLTPIEVVADSVSEVVSPVVVSTLTNIGIFLPMVFVAGFAGKLFKPVALTITFALIASLIVALTVIPVLALRFSHSGNAEKTKKNEDEGDGLLRRLYLGPLGLALRRPWIVLLCGLIPAALVFFVFGRLNIEFLPQLDESALQLQITMPPGTSLPEARRVNVEIEQWLAKAPGVLTVARSTGHAPGTLDVDSVNRSDINAKLMPKRDRPVPLDELITALQSKTDALADVSVNYLMPLTDKINDALGGIPFDMGVDIFGPDLSVLHSLSDRLIRAMKKIPGISQIQPPEDIPIPALNAKINRKSAGRLGISTRSIFDVLRAASLGLNATSVRYVFKSVGVVIHFIKAGQNFDMEAVNSLPLRTAGGSMVPLEQVADLSYSQVPSKIYHEHLSRKATVAVNIKGRNVNDVARDVSKAVADLNLPRGYSWAFSGKYKSQKKALGNMGMVLLMAIAVVAFILWAEFRSLTQTALILLTIPLAAVGAFLSLWIFRQTLNVSSMIGAVMLVGIVVRNGIMMLDYINAEIRNGKDSVSAAKSAALKRVRPILMTASVAALGLLPIATGWGTGSELLRPLAIAVIGGIVTSTLLTLVVLPAAASIFIKR